MTDPAAPGCRVQYYIFQGRSTSSNIPAVLAVVALACCFPVHDSLDLWSELLLCIPSPCAEPKARFDAHFTSCHEHLEDFTPQGLAAANPLPHASWVEQAAPVMLQGCITKAKKLPKLSSETKADIEAFEGKLAATALDKQEEVATADAALQQAAGPADTDMDMAAPGGSSPKLHLQLLHTRAAQLSPSIAYLCAEANFSTSRDVTIISKPSGIWDGRSQSPCNSGDTKNLQVLASPQADCP